MELPEGFALACVMEREDPRDALVSTRFAGLDELPQGAVVGTSSLRRVVLLRALRPDLKIEALRGNLDTRLRKLDDGQYDAIVLAAAGLNRLGLRQRIRQLFEPEQMLPAAGQGALGIEVRADRADLLELLAPLAHQATWLAVAAERAVSRAMGGSCSMPLAAHATFSGEHLQLRAAWGDPDRRDRLGAGARGRRRGRPCAGRRTGDCRRRAAARRRRPLKRCAMQVLVTRPQAEASRWVEDLRRRGFDPVALPLIAIVPVPQPQALQDAWAPTRSLSRRDVRQRQRGAPFLRAPARDHLLAQPYPCLGARDRDRRCAGRGRCSSRPRGCAFAASRAIRFRSTVAAGGRPSGGGRSRADRARRGSGRKGRGTRLAGRAAGRRGRGGAGHRRLSSRSALCSARRSAHARFLAQPRGCGCSAVRKASPTCERLLPAQDWSQARALATHPRIAQAARLAGFGVVASHDLPWTPWRRL